MRRGVDKPTIKDVAQEAGVSLGTASRVINNFDEVTPALRTRVLDAIQRLGYTPNALAQGMRSRSTRTLGILIRDFSAPAFVNFAMSAQAVMFEQGYVPLLASYHDDPARELQIVRAFGQRRIDGLIVTTSGNDSPELVEARRQINVPTILFDREPQGFEDSIEIDHRGGVETASRYLFSLGHRRIALLTGQHTVRPAFDRLQGFQAAHDAANIALDPLMIRAGSFDSDFAEHQTFDLLSLADRPTGLIVGGVSLLPGVLRAVKAMKLRVPKDVSVIGSTNQELCELFTPTITELAVDYGAIGQRAANLVISRVEAPTKRPPETLKFETQLVLRESCAPPPSA